jgi:hypothetical protein
MVSPGTPAFSTTKTGRHDIDEILLKVALKKQKNHMRRRRVFSPLFCNIQSLARTHAVLVIGLYELLDPTT